MTPWKSRNRPKSRYHRPRSHEYTLRPLTCTTLNTCFRPEAVISDLVYLFGFESHPLRQETTIHAAFRGFRVATPLIFPSVGSGITASAVPPCNGPLRRVGRLLRAATLNADITLQALQLEFLERNLATRHLH